MDYELQVDDALHAVAVTTQASETLSVQIAGQTHSVQILDRGAPLLLLVDGQPFEVAVHQGVAHTQGLSAQLRVKSNHTAINHKQTTADGLITLRSPMPGRVVRVLCEVGQAVTSDQPLVVLEAMKMENELQAPAAGRVQELCVEAGATIDAGAVLLRLQVG